MATGLPRALAPAPWQGGERLKARRGCGVEISVGFSLPSFLWRPRASAYAWVIIWIPTWGSLGYLQTSTFILFILFFFFPLWF